MRRRMVHVAVGIALLMAVGLLSVRGAIEDAEGLIERAGVDPSVRAEDVSLGEYALLADEAHKLMSS